MLLTFALANTLGSNLMYQMDDLVVNALARRKGRDLFSPSQDALESKFIVALPFWRPNQSDDFFLEYLIRNKHLVVVGARDTDSQAIEKAKSKGAFVATFKTNDRRSAWASVAEAIDKQLTNNQAYQNILWLEGSDKIHRKAFCALAYQLKKHSAVQLPLLPTPGGGLAGAIYSDDQIDTMAELAARSVVGARLPFLGSGLAMRRDFFTDLQKLQFDWSSAYKLGFALTNTTHRSYYLTAFEGEELIAVYRERPTKPKWAMVRRTSWSNDSAVEGFKLGWSSRIWENYFFWRDRRGLVFLFIGIISSTLALASSFTAPLSYIPFGIGALVILNLVLLIFRVISRSKKVFLTRGLLSALATPLRWPLTSFLQTGSYWLALAAALKRIVIARRSQASISGIALN